MINIAEYNWVKTKMKKTPDGKLRELQNEDQGQKNKSRQTEDKVERWHTYVTQYIGKIYVQKWK